MSKISPFFVFNRSLFVFLSKIFYLFIIVQSLLFILYWFLFSSYLTIVIPSQSLCTLSTFVPRAKSIFSIWTKWWYRILFLLPFEFMSYIFCSNLLFFSNMSLYTFDILLFLFLNRHVYFIWRNILHYIDFYFI